MIGVLTLGDYITGFLRHETSLLSMEDLLAPFGINHKSSKVENISFAEVFARLENEFQRSQIIDAIDVAAAAGALGCEEALTFLEEGDPIPLSDDNDPNTETSRYH